MDDVTDVTPTAGIPWEEMPSEADKQVSIGNIAHQLRSEVQKQLDSTVSKMRVELETLKTSAAIVKGKVNRKVALKGTNRRIKALQTQLPKLEKLQKQAGKYNAVQDAGEIRKWAETTFTAINQSKGKKVLTPKQKASITVFDNQVRSKVSSTNAKVMKYFEQLNSMKSDGVLSDSRVTKEMRVMQDVLGNLSKKGTALSEKDLQAVDERMASVQAEAVKKHEKQEKAEMAIADQARAKAAKVQSHDGYLPKIDPEKEPNKAEVAAIAMSGREELRELREGADTALGPYATPQQHKRYEQILQDAQDKIDGNERFYRHERHREDDANMVVEMQFRTTDILDAAKTQADAYAQKIRNLSKKFE